jgi:hypothetical protein
MAGTNLKTTNYVVVVDFEEGMCLTDAYLLGWDNKYDWYTADIDACDIMTPKGNIKKCHYGILIEVDRWNTAYVGHEQKDCIDACDGANQEGYNCTVCKLEKDAEGEWILIPVYPVGEEEVDS